MSRPSFHCILILTALLSTGCQSAYYGAWEKLGWHKRDILVDRVKEARDDQQAAKEQFKTTLQRFSEVVKFQGGDLEAKYNKLKADYDRCEGKAKDVTNQIASVESVSDALFKEWKDELAQYSNADLRRASEQQMHTTRIRYEQLIGAMKRAEQKMYPVLAAFKDQVLYMKHNLNARAIAALQNTTASIESDVSSLIKEMETSISEANSFITEMKDK